MHDATQPDRRVLFLAKGLAVAGIVAAVAMVVKVGGRGQLFTEANLTALAILVYGAPVLWVLGNYPDELPGWARFFVPIKLHESWKNDCVYAARRADHRNGLSNVLCASVPSFLGTWAGLTYGFFAGVVGVLLGWILCTVLPPKE